jgi:hypothetical protein
MFARWTLAPDGFAQSTPQLELIRRGRLLGSGLALGVFKRQRGDRRHKPAAAEMRIEAGLKEKGGKNDESTCR